MTPVAQTPSGDLHGTTESGVAVFRAVPYAAPPVGDLRFAPPQPHAPWAGLRDATVHGPIAPQTPSRLRAAMGDFDRTQSEDCLTLTIWTPAADAKPRPVLVWLHGGAWMSGAGSLDWYSGATMAREGDIVVVGVNYRLGALGYLHHPAISPGNLGTADQIAALRWIATHIAAFGGDPACITLAGQSAGATSIGRLVLDPVARPLFHRILLQSGSFGRPPLAAAEAATRAETLLRHLDIDPDAADAPSKLRDTPPAQLLAASGALARGLARFASTNPPFMPIVATPTTGEALIARIAAAADGLDVMIGVTRDEVHAFFAADPAMADLDEPRARAHIGARFPHYQARRPSGSPLDWLADHASDDTFIQPSWALAAALPHAYAYRFDYTPQDNPFRACHCAELPFTFGTLDAFAGAGMLEGANPATAAALSARMRRDWLGFIRTGRPGPEWPAYGPARLAMRFNEICEPAAEGPTP